MHGQAGQGRVRRGRRLAPLDQDLLDLVAGDAALLRDDAHGGWANGREGSGMLGLSLGVGFMADRCA